MPLDYFYNLNGFFIGINKLFNCSIIYAHFRFPQKCLRIDSAQKLEAQSKFTNKLKFYFIAKTLSTTSITSRSSSINFNSKLD